MKQQIKTAWEFLCNAVKTILIDICYMLGIIAFIAVFTFSLVTYYNTECRPGPEQTQVCFTVYPDLYYVFPWLK